MVTNNHKEGAVAIVNSILNESANAAVHLLLDTHLESLKIERGPVKQRCAKWSDELDRRPRGTGNEKMALKSEPLPKAGLFRFSLLISISLIFTLDQEEITSAVSIPSVTLEMMSGLRRSATL